MGLEHVEPELRRIVKSLAERLAGEGARAVVLTGSVARGTAQPDSDVDLFAVGEGPSEHHEP